MADSRAPAHSGSSTPPNPSQTPAAPASGLPPFPDLTGRSPAEMTLAELRAAIDVFPRRIEELRETYEHLVNLSPFSLPFHWDAMEAHLSSLHAEMSRRLLAAQASSHDDHDQTVQTAEDGGDLPAMEMTSAVNAKSKTPSPNPKPESGKKAALEQEPAPRRPLVVACEGMVASTLVDLVRDRGRDIRAELLPALRGAANAAVLVLDAVRHLVAAGPRDERVWENCAELVRAVPALAGAKDLSEASVERAAAVAKEWSATMLNEHKEDYKLLCRAAMIWALLHFVAAYGICDVMSDEEAVMLFYEVRYRKESDDLLKRLGLPERATELIYRLLENGKQVDALKVARVFNLTDKYPPVSLMKAYVEKIKEAAQEMLSKDEIPVHSLDDAMKKDVAGLRSAKEAIELRDTDSSYRYTIMTEVHKLMQKYEKKKMSLKYAAKASSSK